MSKLNIPKPNIPSYEDFEFVYGERATAIYAMIQTQFKQGYLQGYGACLEKWNEEERATNERLRALIK